MVMMIMIMCACLAVDMSFMRVRCVAAMVMSQFSCRKRRNEYGQSYGKRDSFPSEMSAGRLPAADFCVVFVVVFVEDVSVAAVCPHSAIGVVRSVAVLFMDPVVDDVCNDSYANSNYKQQCKDKQCLVRNHGQHDECLVA